MIHYSVESITPVAVENYTYFYSLAFDGCHLYLTARDKIVEYDPCTGTVVCTKPCRNYQYLCRDLKCGGFWASAPNFSGTLFKLNENFIEIDRLSLPCCCNEDCTQITGLSFDCCIEGPVIAYKDHLCKIPHCDPRNAERVELSDEGTITGVLSAPPATVLSVFQCSRQRITIITPDGSENIPVPQPYCINGLVLDPCRRCKNVITLYALLMKHACYPYIARINIVLCDFELLPCNFCCNNCCLCGDCNDECGKLLSGAADTERKIAALLNEVGRLLQKGITESRCAEQLLCLNESVTDSITRITELEIASSNKLREITKCCCPCQCDDKPAGCPDPNCIEPSICIHQ